MKNVIDLQQKREERIKKAEKQKEVTQKELKKRRRFKLSPTETYVLLYACYNYLSYLQDMYESGEEEIEKREIKILFSLLKRLFKRYKHSNPYEDIIMNWDAKDIYYALVALEINYDIEMSEGYVALNELEKVEIHLYHRVRTIHNQLNELIESSSLVDAFDDIKWIRDERLKIENKKNMFEYSYAEEFLNKVVLIHESSAYLEGVHIFSQYYVKQSTKKFMQLLKKLSRNDTSNYNVHYCDQNDIEFESSIEPDLYTFSAGWRINAIDIDEMIELGGYRVEVISFEEQEQAKYKRMETINIFENKLDDLVAVIKDIGIGVNGDFIWE